MFGVQDQISFEWDNEARCAESQETICTKPHVAEQRDVPGDVCEVKVFDCVVRYVDLKESVSRQYLHPWCVDQDFQCGQREGG